MLKTGRRVLSASTLFNTWRFPNTYGCSGAPASEIAQDVPWCISPSRRPYSRLRAEGGTQKAPSGRAEASPINARSDAEAALEGSAKTIGAGEADRFAHVFNRHAGS